MLSRIGRFNTELQQYLLLGLICCQGLVDLTLSYNNIALTSEVKVLASLPTLTQLAVDGMFFEYFMKFQCHAKLLSRLLMTEFIVHCGI